MSFCSLIKEIILGIHMLCFVQINSVLLNLSGSWISFHNRIRIMYIYIYKCVFSSLFIVKISEAHLEPGEILYVQPFSCTYIYINACRTDLTLTISCDCQSKRLSSGYPQTTTVFRLPTYYNRLQTTHRLQLSSGYPQTTTVFRLPTDYTCLLSSVLHTLS